MATINEVKKEIESLTTTLSSENAQQIFSTIIFKKKVQEGLIDVQAGRVSDWKEFKEEMKTWYKSK